MLISCAGNPVVGLNWPELPLLPGVAFSREPKPSGGGFEAVSISVSSGTAGVVDGTSNGLELSVWRDTLKVGSIGSTETNVEFSEENAVQVANLAMDLEERLSMGALDIEFALDSQDGLYLLQARSDVACPWNLQTPFRWTLQKEPSGPVVGLVAKAIAQGLTEGYRALSSACGAPLDFDFQMVNNFMYKKSPPKYDFKWLLSSLFGIRSFILGKTWERDIDDWSGKVQPELQSEVDRLADVPLENLGEEELKKHIDDCLRLLQNGTIAHRRFSISMMAMLDLFVFARNHLPSFGEKEKLILIRMIEKKQQRTVRANWLSHSGERIQAFFRSLDADQKNSLQKGQILEYVEKLASMNGGEASEAARQLLRGAQTWSFGQDVMSKTVFEEREFLSHELDRGLDFEKKPSEDSMEDGSALLLLVPPQRQEEMRRLLAKAISAAPIREDRFCFHQQAMALLRLALLEAGARCVRKGSLKFKEEMLGAPSRKDLAAALSGDDATSVSKAYQRLQATRRTKMKAPEFLPLQKATTKSDKSLVWLGNLVKVLRFFPQVAWFTAMEMTLDWQLLDNGPASEQVLEPTSQGDGSHFGLQGIAVDELSGVVQGIARVGLDGLKPEEEILVVKETSVSYVKYFATLRGLAGPLVWRISFERTLDVRGQSNFALDSFG